MPRQVLLDNEFVAMWYYPESKIIHHQFRQPIGGEPFKKALTTGLEMFRLKGASKWLSDDRANSILPPEDTDWSMHIWLPEVVRAGWKFWALVLPEKRLGQINMKWQVEEIAKLGVTVRFFTDPTEAMAWLETQ